MFKSRVPSHTRRLCITKRPPQQQPLEKESVVFRLEAEATVSWTMVLSLAVPSSLLASPALCHAIRTDPASSADAGGAMWFRLCGRTARSEEEATCSRVYAELGCCFGGCRREEEVRNDVTKRS